MRGVGLQQDGTPVWDSGEPWAGWPGSQPPWLVKVLPSRAGSAGFCHRWSLPIVTKETLAGGVSGLLLVDVGSREDSQVPQNGSDIQRAGCYRPGDPRAPKQEGLEALSPGWVGAGSRLHCPLSSAHYWHSRGERQRINFMLASSPHSHTAPAHTVPSQVQMRVCVLQEDKWSQLGRCFWGPHIPFLHRLLPSIPMRPCAQMLGSVACSGCPGNSCWLWTVWVFS